MEGTRAEPSADAVDAVGIEATGLADLTLVETSAGIGATGLATGLAEITLAEPNPDIEAAPGLGTTGLATGLGALTLAEPIAVIAVAADVAATGLATITLVCCWMTLGVDPRNAVAGDAIDAGTVAAIAVGNLATTGVTLTEADPEPDICERTGDIAGVELLAARAAVVLLVETGGEVAGVSSVADADLTRCTGAGLPDRNRGDADAEPCAELSLNSAVLLSARWAVKCRSTLELGCRASTADLATVAATAAAEPSLPGVTCRGAAPVSPPGCNCKEPPSRGPMTDAFDPPHGGLMTAACTLSPARPTRKDPP